MNRRLHYLDWLRVIAILLLFPFHSARVFDVFEPFYSKSASLSVLLSWSVVAWLNLWQMPLFFLVAGMSAYFALSKRTGGQFMKERSLRLLIPFVFGSLVLIPPQTWYGARTNLGYTGSFRQYVASGAPLDFHNLLTNGDYFGGYGMGQMWFVLFLFVISAAALPVFLWVRGRESGRAFGSWASRSLGRPAWWWLPPLLLVLMEPMPAPGGKNLLYFFVLVVLGFLLMSSEEFSEDAKRHGATAFFAGFAGSIVLLTIVALYRDPSGVNLYSFAMSVLRQTSTWLILLGGFGLAARYLDQRSPALDYLSEGGYPIYILHQTVIVALAFYIVKIPAQWPVQYPLVLASAVVATFALYEGVRRVNWLRFLFGMKSLPTPSAVPAEEGVAAQ